MIISRLFIYPIKSCAGVEVQALHFDRNGPVGDRRFLIITPDGRFVTQRELPAMARIQPALEPGRLRLQASGADDFEVELPAVGERRRVQVWGSSPEGIDCGDAAADWLNAVLGITCRLVQLPEDNDRIADRDYVKEDVHVGYADGFPLLVINDASIRALSEASGLDVDVRRFRPNIVVQGESDAFAELGWAGVTTSREEVIRFVKPCERCVIPTRNPDTLERTPEVTRALATLCRPADKIIFGQNAVFSGRQLNVGEQLEVLKPV